jgi:hypothetical protein
MQDSGTLFLSCMLRYLSACPPIVHAYIATNKLVVHACRITSLSIVYIIGIYEYALLSCMFSLLQCLPSYRACLPCYEHSRYACMGISHINMYVTSTLEHGCALLSCMLRYFNACPSIMHAYIATTPLIVHARVSKSLSSMYPHCALLMYMNVHSYHACYEPFRCSRLHEHIV